MFEETPEQRTERLRQRALELAIGSLDIGASQVDILKRAEEYFHFLIKPQ